MSELVQGPGKATGGPVAGPRVGAGTDLVVGSVEGPGRQEVLLQETGPHVCQGTC